MLNVTDEVNRLKLVFSMRGVPDHVIEGVAKEIREEVAVRTYTALDHAMQQARNMGIMKGSEEYLNELTAVKIGDAYEVTTDSGNKDFSVAPFPMLPKLLKNGKVSKDGSIYKVIPIRKKSSSKTTEQLTSDINRAREDMKRIKTHRDKSEIFIDLYDRQKRNINERRNRESPSGDVSFRTVSSKQDANTQWVNPGKDADMTGDLRIVNDNLREEVEYIIRDVISKYEGAI